MQLLERLLGGRPESEVTTCRAILCCWSAVDETSEVIRAMLRATHWPFSSSYCRSVASFCRSTCKMQAGPEVIGPLCDEGAHLSTVRDDPGHSGETVYICCIR